MKLVKRGLIFVLCLAIALPLVACGDKEKGGKHKGEVITVKFGTHALADDDPTYVDPVTGDYGMKPEDREAYAAAMEKVEEELGVKIEWIEWSGPVVTDGIYTDILKSMLAGDPICDLALCWPDSKATVLQQNVFQELDGYADMFKGEEYEWMWMPGTFGKHYFLNPDRRLFGSGLSFNIQMIEAVDALKDSSGNTIYPTDLYKQGKWTFSTFKDYLTKIQAHYSNKKSPVSQNQIQACQTEPFADAAIKGCGGYIIDENGKLGVAEPEAIQGVRYVKELLDAGLLNSLRYGANNPTCLPSTDVTAAFANGDSVFTRIITWGTGYVGGALAERGESMGMVPYPVSDELAGKVSPITASYADGCGVLRGIGEERTKRVLEAFRLYYHTFYCEKYDLDNLKDFVEKTGEQAAIFDGYDIYHEKIGADILNVYKEYWGAECTPSLSDYALSMEWKTEIVNRSIFNLGLPEYSVAIKSKMPELEAKITALKEAVSSGKLNDSEAPVVKQNKVVPAAKGSGESDVTAKIMDYITVDDAAEGELGGDAIKLDLSAVNFGKVGSYTATVTATDGSGNEGTGKITVAVYNPDNKTAPTITLLDPYRVLKLGEELEEINWAKDFIKSALDADGLDVTGNLEVNTDALDINAEGEYTVTAKVKDFAGNEATKDIQVAVVNY